jgi:hypothetical protein
MSDTNPNVQEVLTDAIYGKDDVKNDPNNLSLDALVLLLNKQRLEHLSKQSRKEFETLKERQGKVSKLNKLLKAINSNTNDKGEFNCNENQDLINMLNEAREEVDIKTGKTAFNKDERDRLVENIRLSIEDYNVQNDMQLQTITRLTNERYESYQLARSILKPLHEDKLNKARAIQGR